MNQVVKNTKQYPLPWCVFIVIPGYIKAFHELCQFPADHVYVSGFETEKKALDYISK